MAAAFDKDELARAGGPRWSAPLYAVIVVLLAALFVGADVMGARLHNGDIDDQLRAIQVKALIQGSGWYDMSLPSIHMPEIYRSPWSRLIDAPYALLAMTFGIGLPSERALQLAFLVWPPMMGLLFCLLMVGVLGRVAPEKKALAAVLLIAMIVLMPLAVWEFSPGRIDHHNLQMLLLMMLAYGVARFDARGGTIAGIAIAASVIVGLEALPVLALVAAGMAWAWVKGMEGARDVLCALALSCALATAVLTAIFVGPSAVMVAQNDTFSAPFALALVGSSIGLLALLRYVPDTGSATLRLAGLAALAAATLALLLVLFPQMRAGPYAAMDPVVRSHWFDRIHQEMSVLQLYRGGEFGLLRLVILFGIILVFSLRPAVAAFRAGSPRTAILFAMAAGLLSMTLLSNRYLRFAAASVPLLLPLAVQGVRELGSRTRRLSTSGEIIALVLILCGAASAYLAVPAAPARHDAFDVLINDSCEGADFSVLQGLSPGHILTPPGLGLEIASRSLPGLTVSSIPFHRASPGIRHVLDIFMTEGPQQRAALLSKFDYLAVCRAPPGLEAGERLPLLASLSANVLQPDLMPLGGDPRSRLILLRIDKRPSGG